MLIRSRIFPPECLVSQRFQMKSRVWCRQKQRPSAVWIVIFRTLRSLKSRLPNVRPQAERSVCNLKETKGKELSLTNKESFHINLTIIANYHDQWGPLTIMGLGAHEMAARGRSDMLIWLTWHCSHNAYTGLTLRLCTEVQMTLRDQNYRALPGSYTWVDGKDVGAWADRWAAVIKIGECHETSSMVSLCTFQSRGNMWQTRILDIFWSTRTQLAFLWISR